MKHPRNMSKKEVKRRRRLALLVNASMENAICLAAELVIKLDCTPMIGQIGLGGFFGSAQDRSGGVSHCSPD